MGEHRRAQLQRLLQWIREVKPKLDAMRDAALVAAALERRTHCRTAVMDDIMASWLTNLRATRLEIERDRSAPLSAQLESLFAWLLDVLQGNRYFVEQWKVFPADWKVPSPGLSPVALDVPLVFMSVHHTADVCVLLCREYPSARCGTPGTSAGPCRWSPKGCRPAFSVCFGSVEEQLQCVCSAESIQAESAHPVARLDAPLPAGSSLAACAAAACPSPFTSSSCQHVQDAMSRRLL